MKETIVKCDICHTTVDVYETLIISGLSIEKFEADICAECARKLKLLCGYTKAENDGKVYLFEDKIWDKIIDWTQLHEEWANTNAIKTLIKNNTELKKEIEQLKEEILNLKKNKKEVYVPYPVHHDFRFYDPVYPKVSWTPNSVNTACCCENINKNSLNYKQVTGI